MKYAKERYEELINNSPLFEIDKERDSALYKTEKEKLVELINEYYSGYVFVNGSIIDGLHGRESNTFSEAKQDKMYTVFLTALECIKYYDKSKGSFLHLLNASVSRKIKTTVAKNAEENFRGGIVIENSERKKIRAILKYANSKRLDLSDIKDIQKIAAILNLPVAETVRLIEINSNATTVSDTVKNDDGEEVSLFDTVAAEQATAVDALVFEEYFKAAERVFNSLQERSKERISQLFTFQLIKNLSVDEVKELKHYSFYSEEVVREAVQSCLDKTNYTARIIYARLGITEANGKKSLTNFINLLKTQCKP